MISSLVVKHTQDDYENNILKSVLILILTPKVDNQRWENNDS